MYKLPRVLLRAPARIVAGEWKTNRGFSSRGYQVAFELYRSIPPCPVSSSSSYSLCNTINNHHETGILVM